MRNEEWGMMIREELKRLVKQAYGAEEVNSFDVNSKLTERSPSYSQIVYFHSRSPCRYISLSSIK